jgi:uncharacterized BrkB/YihY/UPF0761 family membrane protein
MDLAPFFEGGLPQRLMDGFLLTAALFEIGKFLIGLYIGKQATSRAGT